MNWFNKRGDIEMSELVWWLVAAAVLVIVVIGVIFLFGSGKSGMQFIRELLKFGR